MSVAEIKKSLDPVLLASRKYLLEQDITEEELEQIMAETKASDEDIILVAMLLSGQDFKQVGQDVAKNKSWIPSIFATPCYAGWSPNYDKILDCALSAIGLDFIGFGFASTARSWGKAAIKKAFTTVAKRALGPVGAAIAVVEFGLCMHSSCSIYATPEAQRRMDSINLERKMEELAKKKNKNGLKLPK